MNKNLKPGPGGWTDITVARRDGPSDVRAQIIGPFAVHRNVIEDRLWVITHIRSGCSVRNAIPLLSEAAAAAKEMTAALGGVGADISDPWEFSEQVKQVDGFMALVKTLTPSTYPSLITKENYSQYAGDS